MKDRVTLCIRGKTYESLSLIIQLDKKERIAIQGVSKDSTVWDFFVPDNVYQRSTSMDLLVSESDSTKHNIMLLIPDLTPKNIGSLFFIRGDSLNLVFQKTTHQQKVPFYRYRDVTSDFFVASNYENSELAILIESFAVGYSMFHRGQRDTLSYSERIEKYKDFTNKYPNSHSSISRLATTLTFYKTKEDVSKVFNGFSEKNKQSYYGEKVRKYLTTSKFENTLLPLWGTDRNEAIVADSTKYNLVIFSASWCAPCHAQIPILKELYRDLGKNLVITYISIDEQITVDNWSKLIKSENILWRSLLATNDIQNIIDKYTAQTIPHSLFVHPDGYFEVVDVRKEDDKNKIYKLIHSSEL